MSHSFKRVEEKYLLPINTAESIKKVIKESEQFRSYSIKTYYMESPEYSIYHMKKERISSRFKVRIREYDSNRPVWIELKEKSSGMGYKNRFKIDRELLVQYLKGEDCFDAVVERNKKVDIEYLELLYRTIRELIGEYKLKPTIAVSYDRLAFDSGLKGAPRYTFDHNLKSAKISMEELFKPFEGVKEFDENQVVMELKTLGTHPVLMKKIKKDFSLKRDRFSKFLFAMEAHFTDLSDSVNIGNGRYKPLVALMK